MTWIPIVVLVLNMWLVWFALMATLGRSRETSLVLVLELVQARHGRDVGLAAWEIAIRANVPLHSVYRLLRNLEARGEVWHFEREDARRGGRPRKYYRLVQARHEIAWSSCAQ